MMKKNNLSIWISLYAILLSAILMFAVSLLLRALKQERMIGEVKKDSSLVYVYLEKESESAFDAVYLPSPEGFWAREYREKIGIFYPDGSLYKVLDTYVKTLPESDRHLLKEGIYLENERQLSALIEDYS